MPYRDERGRRQDGFYVAVSGDEERGGGASFSGDEAGGGKGFVREEKRRGDYC